MSNPQELIKNHLLWLKEKTIVEQLDGWVGIITPYLDNHNDQIQVYVFRLYDGQLILADNGYTLAGGYYSDQVKKAISDLSLEFHEGELMLTTTKEMFNHDFLRFITALSVVSYLSSNQEWHENTNGTTE